MTADDLDGLPGGDLVRKGLDDAARGVRSREALLVAIGAPRLRGLGLRVPALELPTSPELALYVALAAEDPRGAHAAYNALVRRLVSCERALDRAAARRAADA